MNAHNNHLHKAGDPEDGRLNNNINFTSSSSRRPSAPSSDLQVSLALLVLLRFLQSYSYFSSSRDREPGLNLICTAGEEDRAIPEKRSRAKKKKTCVRPPATKKKRRVVGLTRWL